MIGLADIQTWLTDASVPNVLIDWLPETPDQCVVINGAGGGAPIYDGTFEATHVLVRSRDATDAAAEALARTIHQLVTHTEVSFTAGDTYVLTVESFAPPRFLGRDPNQRAIFGATYAFTCPT